MISTRGVTVSTAATTGSKARASRSASYSTTVTEGDLPCASRRRRPRRTPSARAAAEQATTRLAKTTATGSAAPSKPAAVTGQSGIQTVRVRTASTGQVSNACSIPSTGTVYRPDLDDRVDRQRSVDVREAAFD